MLNRLCVGILLDSCFAERSFALCEKELSYHRKLHDAIGENMKVADED